MTAVHTFIQEVNGYKIKHWTLGDVYYIQGGSDWIIEDKDLSKVIEFVMKK
ncbi:hypothetical protein MHL86_10475 [Brevibacillus laterosporus]|nr:hypothetical protein [Brevibacillus laterosporus]